MDRLALCSDDLAGKLSWGAPLSECCNFINEHRIAIGARLPMAKMTRLFLILSRLLVLPSYLDPT